MASIASTANIERLTGRENYNTWKFAVKTYLQHEDLWDCVADDTILDDKKDIKAKSKIILLIDPINYVHIQNAVSAKEVWNLLSKAFDDSGLTRKVGLLKDLINTNLDSCSNVEEYVNKIMGTAHKLRNIGFSVDDEWLGTLLLAGLPDIYKPMIMALESSNISISADLVKSKILQEVTPIDPAAFFSNHKKYGKNKNSTKSKGPRCYSCNKYGHISTNCRNNKKGNDNNSGFLAAFSASNTLNDCWYIDSGASMHMTCHYEWLYDHKPSPIASIKIADNTQLEVQGCGNVNIKVNKSDKTELIQVRNVLFVPQLKTNLLSVSEMTRNGCQLDFNKDGCNVLYKGKLVLTAKCSNNMYIVNNYVYAYHVNAYMWHQRLAHLNFNDLAKIQDTTLGVNLSQVPKPGSVICATCIEGKQSRQPFKHQGSRASDFLGIVHSDICGPMENKSLGGAKYFITFIDDYTRRVQVYFINSKSDALEKFKDFKNFAENQLDKKIKILRTDNGKEYINKQFETFMKQTGIVHQTTNPYTPEQNGLAERMNRTLVERAKCMLLNSSLPKPFWAEAVSTAAYIINRSPTKSLEYKTPQEVWSGRKPDLSHLKIFGCKAMVQIPKERRQKWDSKSKKMIFVGYCDDTKGYRLYDESKKQIIKSRNVVFLEREIRRDYVYVPLMTSHIDNPKEPHGDTSDQEASFTEDYSTGDEGEEYIPEVTIGEVTPSQRTLRPRKGTEQVKKTYLCQTVSTNHLLDDPDTVEMAMQSDKAEMWKLAMDSEYNSLLENNTWTLTDLPAGKRAIPCKWVYKTKYDVDGNISKYKARLVIKGYEQRAGIDYELTYAPVVRITSIRYLLGLAVKYGMKIEQMDAVTAFLQGDIDVDLYMAQPPSYEQGNKVCKLNKSIYGLKQASRRWNIKLHEVLHDIGLKRSQVDPCVYYNNNGRNFLILTVYVDDLLLFFTDKSEAEVVKVKLMSSFKMQDIGKASYFIGIKITYNNSEISIDQSRYIEQILQRFEMSDCNPVSTPMEPGTILTIAEPILENVPYQEAIGCLMYIAHGTRPDIVYAVNTLSKFNSKPGAPHWQAVKRVMRYLKGTQNTKLTFKPNEENILGYCDADWASNTDDRRSCTGYVFLFQGCAISWNSRRQQTIALSTTEAEYMSLSAAAQEAMWLRQLHKEILPSQSKLYINLFCDNQSAIKLAGHESFQARSKHIDVRHHFIRDKVMSGQIRIQYVGTDAMVADSLTKPTTKMKHDYCMKNMGLSF